MTKQHAHDFFDQIQASSPNVTLKAAVKKSLEKIASDAGYTATEDELVDELAERWKADPSSVAKVAYSEPPGF